MTSLTSFQALGRVVLTHAECLLWYRVHFKCFRSNKKKGIKAQLRMTEFSCDVFLVSRSIGMRSSLRLDRLSLQLRNDPAAQDTCRSDGQLYECIPSTCAILSEHVSEKLIEGALPGKHKQNNGTVVVVTQYRGSWSRGFPQRKLKGRRSTRSVP